MKTILSIFCLISTAWLPPSAKCPRISKHWLFQMTFQSLQFSTLSRDYLCWSIWEANLINGDLIQLYSIFQTIIYNKSTPRWPGVICMVCTWFAVGCIFGRISISSTVTCQYLLLHLHMPQVCYCKNVYIISIST